MSDRKHPSGTLGNGALAALAALNTLPVADLGDPLKTYQVHLTEPEINAIYAGVEFVRSECAQLVEVGRRRHAEQILGALRAHVEPAERSAIRGV